MSTSALLFTGYLGIGLILMIVAVATRGKEERAWLLDFNGGTCVDAALLIFIVVLWPVWLLVAIAKDNEEKK